MEEIDRLTEEEVAREENKIHQRRFALEKSVNDAADLLGITVESTDDESEEDESDSEEDETREDDQSSVYSHDIENLDKCSTPTDDPDLSTDVISSTEDSKCEEPNTSGEQKSGVDEELVMVETPIEDIFFNDDEPCSSAQAEARDKMRERYERQQQLIEDSLKPNRKSVSPSVFKVPESPMKQSGDESLEKTTKVVDSPVSKSTESSVDHDVTVLESDDSDEDEGDDRLYVTFP